MKYILATKNCNNAKEAIELLYKEIGNLETANTSFDRTEITTNKPISRDTIEGLDKIGVSVYLDGGKQEPEFAGINFEPKTSYT